MGQSRTLGYVVASVDRQVESPKTQTAVIESYCKGIGRQVDHVFVDRDSGKQRLFDRVGGKQLRLAVRRNDHVVIARLDRLADSALETARILDQWRKGGIVTHLVNVPGGVLDPGDPNCELLVKFLGSVAESERDMLRLRTRQGLAALKAEGRRYCGPAPMGFKWERRGHRTVMVPDIGERTICARVAELRAEGYSIDRVRQYLAYEWKVRNRNGGEFGNTEVHKMARRGAEWLRADASHGAERVPETASETCWAF